MPLNSIAQISISLADPPAARPGFGTPIVFAVLTAPQVAAFGSDLAIAVTKDTWQAILTSLGITSSEDAWLAMEDLFSQDEEPELALLARRATPVAQVNTYLVGGTTDGSYVISLDGNEASYTASGNTATEIRDALVTALGLLYNAADFAIADVSTDSISVTAQSPGLPFTSSVDSPGDVLTLTISTPNVGMPEDIVAVRAERDDWYAIVEAGHADSDILATARAVEPIEKIFIAQTNDTDALTTGTDDVGAILQSEGLIRTAVLYHDNIDQFVDAAWLGRMLPTDPGSQNWAYKTLRSVTGISPDGSQEANLIGKNYNWLETFAALQKTVTRQGSTAGGQWLDVIRGRDWLSANLQIDLFEVFTNTDKVDYDDGGAELLAAAIRARLEDAADRGLVDRDSIVITVPKALAQSDANRGNRAFPGITWSARLLGAINSLDVSGTLYP